MSTEAGQIFFSSLTSYYKILSIHLSGKGRWFQNADVVTTLLILQKGHTCPDDVIDFFLWKKDLKEYEQHPEWEKELVNSVLLKEVKDGSIVSLSKYSLSEIQQLRKMNLSINALFHDVSWIDTLSSKIVPINSFFEVFRGSRRGWDPLFYPSESNQIEECFLSDVLISARTIENLIAKPDGKAFCCHLNKDALIQGNYTGALEWISRFEGQSNKTGVPLTSVLASKKLMWYELSDKEKAMYFTSMNPEKRFFFGRFEKPTFINQRLIGMRVKEDYSTYQRILFAILNSFLTTFFIESAGFGRGLGVLDINKDTIANTFILNPMILSKEQTESILKAFEPLEKRKIKDIEDEFASEDRLRFEQTLFEAFGIKDYLPKVISSLKSEIETRLTVKSQKKRKHIKTN
jgi:hypothetical protein